MLCHCSLKADFITGIHSAARMHGGSQDVLLVPVEVELKLGNQWWAPAERGWETVANPEAGLDGWQKVITI
jgi:hypothetical protein